MKRLKTLKVFLKICVLVGFNKTTGLLFWKTLLTVIFINPKAIEATVNLAAMFIHFHKQANFIIDYTNKEIKRIETQIRIHQKYEETETEFSFEEINVF